MNRAAAIFILTAILVLEAFLARTVSGSGLHQALLLGAMAGAGGLWWTGGRCFRWGGGLLAVGMALGGWRLARNGVAPTVLSELPFAFSLAMAVHFHAWTRWVAPGLRAMRDGEAGQISSVIASGLVIWTLEQVEIYGSSVFLLRAMAVAGLMGSLMLLVDGRAAPVGNAVVAGVKGSSAKGKAMAGRISFGFGLIAAGLISSWALSWTERAAVTLYGWLSRAEMTTALGEFGQDRPRLDDGDGFVDDSMRQLPRRAQLSLDGTLRFHLWFDESRHFEAAVRKPIYLRTSTMGAFSAGGGMGPIRRGAWIYDSDDGREDGVTTLNRLSEVRRPLVCWALVGREEGRGLPLWAVTGGVGLSGVYAFADDWYQLELEPHQERVRFHLVGTQTRWRDLRETLSGEPREGDAAAEYLQLPMSPLTRRILETAVDVAPTSLPLRERLEGIRRYLAENCAYSLSYANPDDLDPVENFLFQERRGHCELYASGTAMMLRAIGIPSRVALGFSGGEAAPSSRLIAFRQSDFHAWAEIFLADHGWIIFDTTPDGQGAAGPPDVSASPRLFPAVDPGLYEDLGGELRLEGEEVSPWSRMMAEFTGWVSRWFGAICLLAGAMAGFFFWFGRRRSRMDWKDGSCGEGVDQRAVGSEEKDGSRELRDAYLAAWAARGRVKEPGQTLREFVAELKRIGWCGSESDELVAYCYRVRYALEPRDAGLEAVFLEIIESITMVGEGSMDHREDQK